MKSKTITFHHPSGQQRRISLNVQPSPPDARDHKIMFSTNRSGRMPPTINLSSLCPPVYDQGDIGSCTANSASTMFSYICKKNQGVDVLPSRLFLYYNTRVIENNVNTDSGATLRNTMRSLRSSGICKETSWAYQDSLLFQQPTTDCYTEALNYQALSYASVNINLTSMKNALQSGFIFVIGILVFSSFMSLSVANTGIVPPPNTRRESFLGGHAICITGYSDHRQAFSFRNSWGTDWGIQGNGWIPYSYLANRNLAFDAWTLYTAESGPGYTVTRS